MPVFTMHSALYIVRRQSRGAVNKASIQCFINPALFLYTPDATEVYDVKYFNQYGRLHADINQHAPMYFTEKNDLAVAILRYATIACDRNSLWFSNIAHFHGCANFLFQ